MNAYLLVKWVHIVSSVLLVGTGFGSAFYMYFTNRTGNLAAQTVVSRLVVRADNWFTAPTIVIQLCTGITLMHLAGWPLSTPWLWVSISLFLFAGACWLPVVWLQVKMHRLAVAAFKGGTGLPRLYWRYAQVWERLGYPAFIAMLGVYFLMVNKPSLSF